MATKNPAFGVAWRRPWPLSSLSLRARIFLAMVTGALMVHIVAGIEVMNLISNDYDERVALQSYTAGRLALQFYRQQEDQLAHTARVVAGMQVLRTAMAGGDAATLSQVSQHIRTGAQISDTDSLLVYDQRGRLLYADGAGAPPSPPLTLQPILTGATPTNQGAEALRGMPSLIGGASVVSASGDGSAIGAVAIIEPLTGRLLAQTQEQIGSPCSVFDPSGRFIAASQNNEPWPTAFPVQLFHAAATPASPDNPTAGQRVPVEKGADVFLLPLFDPHGNLAATIALYQPTSSVRQLQWNAQEQFFGLILASLLVSATVAWLFSRMLVRPIQRLSVAADEIASGQYDHAIPVRGADEIGRLTQTFERMRRRIRETTGALVDEKRRSEAEAIVVNAVLNATNDGIVMLDADGRFRVANRRWESMFGIDSATLASFSAEELRTRFRDAMDDPDAFDRASDTLQRDPERTVLAEEFAQRWPEARPLRRFSAPVRDQAGAIIGRVFVYTDISKERQADELKQALLSTVSHELRTPLTTIKGYARTLLLDEWDPETRREFLRTIDDEADKLSELVDNLLDLSKLEAGVLQINRQPVLLYPLLSRVVQRRQGTSQRHHFALRGADNLPLVMADPRRLEQVVENLIENARKYAPEGPITVAAVRAGEQIEVSVSDQGPGIPPELVERVFERFYRIDNSLTRDTGGTGLGLSICRGLVEAHGGHIWVRETSSQGTTISFTLPVFQASSSFDPESSLSGQRPVAV